MENLGFRLIRLTRRRRRELLHFLDVVTLNLEVGFDLSHAWAQGWETVSAGLSPDHSRLLAPGEGGVEGMASLLSRLAREYPNPGHRPWFAALAELYQHGAGLMGALTAMGAALRGEHERELEAHCRAVPGRLNIVLLLFYFPAASLLLLLPLLLEILRAFPAH